MATREVKVGNILIGGRNPLAFIAGPCVIEDEDSTLKNAGKLKEYSDSKGIPLIFKSSYDKANRSSVNSFRGPGIKKGLDILHKVKNETGLPVISDVHSIEEVDEAARILDILQIPAFLCRQTDLIIAAAGTGKPVNVKKGQFMAPADARNIIDKVLSTGNKDLILTERGVTFGYNNLVVDMRSIPIMQGFGFPVIYDATHSVQLPGGEGTSSGGQREFIETLARAAVSAGCDAVFMEVHEYPDKAPCDGPNMLPLERFSVLAARLMELHQLIKGWQG
ncbi:MAG TPA: 3-deoxy-8-phosphooctulonate synthase [Nitrospirae bacterium]|nr:2-dehydro-3-deoxyphosphooctonate aldolase [bacterium BMS3Abin06]HDH11858.1 3-deoxy-8-phosphooctulonate synthase [Nitrospirota bacterium]HDZ02800.1 3-deoxy-8-phosphooctulonate synthase [Nitrospirota bacterium]